MRPFFIDTSGWCALYDRSDGQHHLASPFWAQTASRLGALYTSDYILDETLTLINIRISHAAAAAFGRAVLASKVIRVVPVTGSRWENAWEIFIKYNDKEFSFTDCTSFTIMQELNLKEAFTFDRHFPQMGFTSIP